MTIKEPGHNPANRSEPRQKYCIILKPERRKGGFLHNLSILLKGVQYAVLNQRTLILPPAFLGAKQNAGIPANKQIYDYLSLDNTQVTVKGKQQAFSYMYWHELKRQGMANWTTQYQNPDEPFKLNDSADLLIRHKKIKHNLFSVLCSLLSADKMRISFSPSPQYKRLAQQTVDALGGVKSYYALHARRGDRASGSPEVDRATQPDAIIKRLRAWVPEGATLYVLSDEMDEGYFSPLKKHWRLMRYWDFPQLEKLVNQPNPLLVDNHGLFFVEGLIYWQAKIKIATHMSHEIETFKHFFHSRDTDDQRFLLCHLPKSILVQNRSLSSRLCQAFMASHSYGHLIQTKRKLRRSFKKISACLSAAKKWE